MYKQLRSYILLLLLTATTGLAAQSDTLRYDVSWAGVTSSGKYAPFWQQSRRYGTILSDPNSTTFMAGLYKNTDESPGLLKYGFKASLLLQTSGKATNVYFHELYLQGKLSVFTLTVGAREEHIGCQDSTLSGGGILFSGNVRPMPKVMAGIEKFTPIPYTGGWLEVKGQITQGWFLDNTYTKNMLLHHKNIYGRIGGKLPIHLSYGVEHVVEWGGTDPVYGKQPSGLDAFFRVFKGSQGGSDSNLNDEINALGNHIISQSLKVEAEAAGVTLNAYWQNISEDGPVSRIGTTMNASDGLWGVTLHSKRIPFISGILYEYLRTIDQSGPINELDGIIYGGTDGYFTNGIYQSGWNYYRRTIGTPFISSPLYNKNGTIYTLNNRVEVHHFGAEGDICGYRYKALASFSKNYGAYYAPFPSMISNKSFLLEVHKTFPRWYNIEAGCSLAADFGKLYGNSVSGMITLRKRGIFTHY